MFLLFNRKNTSTLITIPPVSQEGNMRQIITKKMRGWISLHRDIQDHWIWKNPVKLKWWLDILLTVNHADTKVNVGNQLFDCKRGQSVMSLQNWATRWGVSKDVVRNFFNLLQKDDMINAENLTKITRITVCKYEEYQNAMHDSQTNQQRNPNDNSSQSHTNNNNNNDNNNTLYIDGEKKIISNELLKTLNHLLEDRIYLETLCMNNSIRNVNDMKDYLKTFFVELENRGENYKDETDAKHHFASWLKIELERKFEKEAKQKKSNGKVAYKHPMTNYNSKKIENDDRW